MKTPEQTVTTCEQSLKLLADFWTLRIIEALKDKQMRYCEVQRAVGNVNPATLTKKLQILEHAQLLERSEDAEHAAVSYKLTKLGRNAIPVLDAVQIFSKKMETHS
jgi:DNA-binding HxlR family transcriptional regulator